MTTALQGQAEPVGEAPLVLREQQGHVAVLTLNRPERMNVLTGAMLATLDGALQAAGEDPAVRVIVLGATGRAFSAGHDLAELADAPQADVEALFTQCTRMMERVRRNPKPVIARVQGVAAAAGCQLVASCDLAVAADTARFGTTGVKAGLFCSTPMVPLSRVAPAKKSLEMLLTGRLVSAAEAEAIGLVNRVVPADELDEATRALAGEIAANSPYAVQLGKRAFYEQQPLDYEGAYAVGQRAIVENTVHADGQEGIHAFLNKRPARWHED